jgi:ATP-binding cassette, subfamily B, bacterial PglK
MKKYFDEIFFLARYDKKHLISLIALFLIISVIDIIGIGLIGPYISIVIDPSTLDSYGKYLTFFVENPKNNQQLVNIFGLLLFCVFFIKAVVAIWINYKIILFSQKQQIGLRSFLMKSYQSMSFSRHVNRNSAEYIHGMGTVVVHYTDNALMPLLRMIGDMIVAVVILSFLAFTNIYALMLFLVILGGLLFLYDRIFKKKLINYGVETNTANSQLIQAIKESINGLLEIRLLKKESYFHDKVNKLSISFTSAQAKSRVIGTSARFLFEVSVIGFVVLLVSLTILVEKNTQSVFQTLLVFGVASVRLLPIANNISTSMTKIRFARDSVALLYKDIKFQDDLRISDDNVEDVRKGDPFEQLIVSNVSYSFANSSSPAIDMVSININAGESIGIIGPSGSGKTTLMNILLGLLEPTSGDIFYNNKPLQEHKHEWQKNVAYIPQKVFLLDDSLRRNVALGINENHIDEKKVVKSLERAQLSDLVCDLPFGIDSKIGEDGIRLSGGQQQRVALARAFYFERTILFMDESTSSLDTETEKEIVQEVQKLYGKITMIIIAHRYSTIKYCDRIYKLSNSRIIQEGKFKEFFNEQSDG